MALIQVSADATRFCSPEQELWGGGRSAQRAARAVYHSMIRFLIRHMVHRANARVIRLMKLHDPCEIGSSIADSVHDRRAWALLLWAFTLEPRVDRRLWCDDERFHPREESSRPWVNRIVLQEHLVSVDLPVSVTSAAKHCGQAQWLQSHCAGFLLREMWGRALGMAEVMANQRTASWGVGIIEAGDVPCMAGTVHERGNASFSCLCESRLGRLVPLLHSDKKQRREDYAERERARAEQIREDCAGYCLVFAWDTGWTTSEATLPDPVKQGADVRRRRLLVAGRPWFYLIQTKRGYCARMQRLPLEVRDTSPWKAIDTLRHALGKYDKLYGRPIADPVPLARLKSTTLRPFSDLYKGEMSNRTFWKTGSMASDQGKRHLAARACAPELRNTMALPAERQAESRGEP